MREHRIVGAVVPSAALWFVVLFVFCGQSVDGSSLQTTSRPLRPVDQQEGNTPEKKREKSGPEDETAKRLREAADIDAMVDRRIAGLLRFKVILFETMSVTNEKKERINQMFDEYFFELMIAGKRVNPVFVPSDITSPHELPELREKFKAAQEAGDSEAVYELQSKIRAAEIVLKPSIQDSPEHFLNYVLTELGKEHSEAFNRVVRKWEPLRVWEITPDHAGIRLTRAFRDPDLAMADEVRSEIVRTLTRSVRGLSAEVRQDPERTAEVAAKLRAEVFEKLTPEQREQVDKTVAMLERWSSEDEKATKEVRERLRSRVQNTAQPTTP